MWKHANFEQLVFHSNFKDCLIPIGYIIVLKLDKYCWIFLKYSTICFENIIQIYLWSLYECVLYLANIMQILYKYCANIVQILRKYCTNIIQIFFESNRAIQEHKRLNRAKCHLPTHWPTDPLTHSLCENTIHWAAYAAKNSWLLFFNIV